MPAKGDKPDTRTQQVPQVTGIFQLPGGQLVVDAMRQGIVAETITGGVPDASDPLPEGTIIVRP